MPTVWVRNSPKHRNRFHKSPDCRQLRKGPQAGPGYELISMDLAEVGYRPCHTCYPDAPWVKIRKTRCPECDTKYACPHNGGVLVIDRGGRKLWVWPDTNQMPYYRSRVG
jgi:hypothetical protein